jgi:hypothetical protein
MTQPRFNTFQSTPTHLSQITLNLAGSTRVFAYNLKEKLVYVLACGFIWDQIPAGGIKLPCGTTLSVENLLLTIERKAATLN